MNMIHQFSSYGEQPIPMRPMAWIRHMFYEPLVVLNRRQWAAPWPEPQPQRQDEQLPR